ncbi:hypothetical protein ATCVOR07043_223R [Acanthocystis turfacea Chlorella virus OR0704.3]|nr:hypothetical protein ATCVOR07043_223R [Acanthocystis turfacea Chlorella virus OR0704.3]
MFPAGTIVNSNLLFPEISNTSIAPIRPMTTPPTTSAASEYDVKAGKVVHVFSKDVFIVSYFAGGRDQMRSVGKPGHRFANGQSVFVITKPAPDHSFVSVEAAKPIEGLVPVPDPANCVKIGKVTKVPDEDTVVITYFAAGRDQTKTITKENHGLEVGEDVYVTLTLEPTFSYLGVSSMTEYTPDPVPTPSPIPTPVPTPKPVPPPVDIDDDARDPDPRPPKPKPSPAPRPAPVPKPSPKPRPVPAPVPPPPAPVPPPSGSTIQVKPQGNVGDLRYPKTISSPPSSPTPPAGAVVGTSLSKFKWAASKVIPKGAAPNIDVITQVAPGVTMHGLRFRGKWNDGDRDKTGGAYDKKARSEMVSLGGDDPMRPGGTYLIGTSVYIAPGFKPSPGYCNIMQPVLFQSYLTLSGSKDNLTATLMAFTKGLGSPAKTIRAVKIPTGKWVQLVVKVKFAKDGYYGLSVNGDAFVGQNMDTTIAKDGSGTGAASKFGTKWGLYMNNQGMTDDAVVFHYLPFWQKIG